MFSFFELIVLLGLVQGLITIVLLWNTKAVSTSKTLLIWILVVFIAINTKILLHTFGLWNTTGFKYFPLAIDTTIQPLFYLYVCSLVKPQFKLTRHHLLYFLPTIIFLLHALVVYGTVVFESNFQSKDLIAETFFYNNVKLTEDIIAVLMGVFFWLLSLLSVQRYRRWLFASQSNTTYPELDWLNNILLLSSLLIFLLAITILSENFIHIGPHSFPHLETFYVYISAVIYYLSFKSLRQYKDQGTDERVGQVDTMTAKEDTSYDEQPPFDAGIGEGPGHAENLPVDAEPLLIKEKIIYALETEKLFLNPELNLKDLAKSVGYPSAILSATINKNFGMNFRNLINSYRVEEVKKRIAAGNASHLSLLGIAFECGFNSEASFYRIFRNNTGKSPKDYIHASE